MISRFQDRREAGRLLAARLEEYRGCRDCLLLGLPRGGVVVAAEIARALGLPMDVCLVRKLGAPFQPELAMGAVAFGGVLVLHQDLIDGWGIPAAAVDRAIAREREELQRRESLYRAGRPPLDLYGKTVILVDDGIATGATVEAAISAMRQMRAGRVVVAAAVASAATARRLARVADEVVCVLLPEELCAIGEWYEDFDQVTDGEVLSLLEAPLHERM